MSVIKLILKIELNCFNLVYTVLLQIFYLWIGYYFYLLFKLVNLMLILLLYSNLVVVYSFLQLLLLLLKLKLSVFKLSQQAILVLLKPCYQHLRIVIEFLLNLVKFLQCAFQKLLLFTVYFLSFKIAFLSQILNFKI